VVPFMSAAAVLFVALMILLTAIVADAAKPRRLGILAPTSTQLPQYSALRKVLRDFAL